MTAVSRVREYSVANATRFEWASMHGKIFPERAAHLRRFLIGPKVLDAGCGGGGYTDFVSSLGFDAVGVDKYDMFLANARERGFRGTFYQADLCEALPFPDATFDTTFCFDVLEHIDDIAAIRELARITRRRLIIGVPQEDRRIHNWMLTYVPYLDPTHLRYYTPDTLRELVATVSPRNVQVTEEDRVPLELFVRKEFHVQSKYPVLRWFYRRMFNFLAARASAPDWYINLMAVIDLPGIADPAETGR